MPILDFLRRQTAPQPPPADRGIWRFLDSPGAPQRKRTIAEERRATSFKAYLDRRETAYQEGQALRPEYAEPGFARGFISEAGAPVTTFLEGREAREREAFLTGQEQIAGQRLREPPRGGGVAETAGRLVGGLGSLAGLGIGTAALRVGGRVAASRVGTAAVRVATALAKRRPGFAAVAEPAVRETVRQIIAGAGTGAAWNAMHTIAANYDPLVQLAREDPVEAGRVIATSAGVGAAFGVALSGLLRAGMLTKGAADEVSAALQRGDVDLFRPPPSPPGGAFVAALRQRRGAEAGVRAQETLERGLAARAAAPPTTPGRGVELAARPGQPEGLTLPLERKARPLVGEAEHRGRLLELLRERQAQVAEAAEVGQEAALAARPRQAGGVLLARPIPREAPPPVIVPGAPQPGRPEGLQIIRDIRRRGQRAAAGQPLAPEPGPPAPIAAPEAPAAPAPGQPAPQLSGWREQYNRIASLPPASRQDLARQLGFKRGDEAFKAMLPPELQTSPLSRGETWQKRAERFVDVRETQLQASGEQVARPEPTPAPSVPDALTALRNRLQQVQDDLVAATRAKDEARIGQLLEDERGLIVQLNARGERVAPAHPTITQLRARRPKVPEPAEVERIRTDQPLQPKMEVRVGRSARVYDEPGGTAVDVDYAILDANDPRIITSHSESLAPDPRFPPVLQIRGRERVASEAQIQTIMQKLEPEQLGENVLGAHGAPLLGPDGLTESGNGRLIALRRLYSTGHANAAAYRQWLATNAERFGLSRADAEGVRNPVLVRIRKSAVADRIAWTQKLNRPGVAGLGGVERAKVDVDGLTEDVLGLMQADDLTAAANRPFVRAFFEKVGAREDDLTAEGFIAQGGVARLRNALFARAYGAERSATLARIAESTNDHTRNLSNAMIASAARIARVREAIRRGERYTDLDVFGTDLLDAADAFARAKAPGSKITVEEILSGGESLLGETTPSEATVEILRRINEFRQSVPALRRYLEGLADAVDAAGGPTQTDMFGRTRAPALGDVLRVAYQKAAPQGTLFPSAPEPAAPPRPTTPPAAPSPAAAAPPVTLDPINDFLALPTPQRTLVREAVDDAIRAHEATHPGGGRLPVGQVARSAWATYTQRAAKADQPKLAPAWFKRLIAAEQGESETAPFIPAVGTMPAAAAPTAAAAVVPEPVKIADLVAYLDEKIVPVRVGRMGRIKAGTRGIYKTGPEVARSKVALDLGTIGHEVGHHLDKHLNLKALPSLSQVTPLVQVNLAAYKSHQVPGELVAEYLRTWLTNPALAERTAPGFTRDFMAALQSRPEWLKALQETQRRIEAWQQLPAKLRVLGRIGPTPEKQRAITFDEAYRSLVDRLRPLQVAVTKITGGAKIAITKDPYLQAWLYRGWAGRAETWLRSARTDRYGRPIGESLRAVLAPVRGQMDDFKALLLARHADELHTRMIETGFAPADVAEVIQTLGTSRSLTRAVSKYVEYQNALLAELVDSGFISAEVAERFKRRYPYYVSFQRIFREGQGRGVERIGGERFANLPQPIRTIRGSAREIVDPIESVIRRTYATLSIAERNRVGRVLVELAEQYEGAGRFVESVPLPVRATRFRLREIENLLEAAGADLSRADMDRMATIFHPSGAGVPKENILLVWRGGKPKAFQLAPELYNVMNGLNRDSASILLRIAGAPARILRAGAILSPDFPIRNFFRDQIMAGINTQYGYIPGIDWVKGIFHLVRKDEVFRQFESAGGAQAMLTSLDRDTMARTMREIAGNPRFLERAGIRYVNPLELLRDVSDIVEQGTRLGEFARAPRRTAAEIQEAALAARDITLDFSRFGDAGQNLNRLVAFWNAHMQGLDKMRRQFQERPIQTTFRAIAYITVPSVLSYAANRNDPEYQTAPRWAKDLFWMVPGVRLAGRRVWIPKPFELGVIFGSLPERVMEYLDREDPSAFADLTKTLTSPLVELGIPMPRRTAQGEWTLQVPGIVPNALLPFLELGVNHDIFRDRPIVPFDEQALPARLQYGPYTPTVAKEAGRFGISPRKLEHFVEGFTAGLGRYALEAPESTGLLPRRPGETREGVGRFPGLRGFTPVASYSQSQDLQDFYAALRKWEGEVRGRKIEGEVPGRARGHARRFRESADVIADLRKRRDRILASEAPGADRQRRGDALTLQMIARARRTLRRPPLGAPR